MGTSLQVAVTADLHWGHQIRGTVAARLLWLDWPAGTVEEHQFGDYSGRDSP
jgi:hypothetical protein